MARKHIYTHELAPRNTGSVERPARFNLRETIEVHARTTKVFITMREITGMPKDACFADVWEEKMLPLIEHAIWHMKESPTSMKTLIGSLMKPLPKEDYVRNQYERLKERFQPSLFSLTGEAVSAV